MPIWTRFWDPKDCVNAVRATEGFKRTCGAMAVHPYNPEYPDTSVWWVFRPSRTGRNWPAYHLGKFVFFLSRNGDAFFAGLAVEKGIGKALASALGSAKARSYEMKCDWAWHRFMPSLSDGSVEAALETIRRRAGVEPVLELHVGPTPDEGPFPASRTRYVFRNPASDRLVLAECVRREHEIPFAENVMRLSDLRERLEGLAGPEGQMVWVDLLLGVPVPRAPVSGVEPWGGREFWEKVLEPLAPWVVGG
ncbi:hypothetical protein [Deferrisoma sp.]